MASRVLPSVIKFCLGLGKSPVHVETLKLFRSSATMEPCSVCIVYKCYQALPRPWEITGRDVEICFEVQKQWNYAVCASSTSVIKFCLSLGKSPVETLKFVSKFRNNETMQCERRLQVVIKFCLGLGKSSVETLKFVSKFRNNETTQCMRRLQVLSSYA